MTHCILHTQKCLIGYRHTTHDVTHHQYWNSPTRAKISDSWDVMPCSLVEVYQHFWVNYGLHLHGGNSVQKTETYFKGQTAFFWAITQRIVLNVYRRFGTTYRVTSPKVKIPLLFLDSWPLKMGPIETSVRNYHYTLDNSSEEHTSALRSTSLQFRKSTLFSPPWSVLNTVARSCSETRVTIDFESSSSPLLGRQIHIFSVCGFDTAFVHLQQRNRKFIHM